MAKARVLAVDDQRYFRELIEGLLSEEGYDVQTAGSGEEALHRLEREDFDVVITDLVMPGLDGGELCRLIKQKRPDQDIVMVTGVVDVQTAVDAMKQGATDYILKPFDRETLTASLDGILKQRRLREEHARLMEENLEYMGVLSLYERATGLFGTVGLAALAERSIEGLCLETRAQGGAIWIADGLDREAPLALCGMRGLLRTDNEIEELDLDALAPELARELRRGHSVIARDSAKGDPAEQGDRGDPGALGEVLWIPIEVNGQLLGVARLSDRLEGDGFDDGDRARGEKFGSFAAFATANTLRFRALERRSFRDPVTKAYSQAYFQDVVQNEVQKASRFGRHFSILRFRLEDFGRRRRELTQSEFGSWLEGCVAAAGRTLRATDILAASGENGFSILLPETDSLAAAALVQRVRQAVLEACALASGPSSDSELGIAAVTYPSDGMQLEMLDRTLESRLDSSSTSLARTLELGSMSFAGCVEALLEQGHREPAAHCQQLARYVLDDVAARPNEGAFVIVAPDDASGSLDEPLEAMANPTTETVGAEVIVMGGNTPQPAAGPLTCLPAERIGTSRSFLVYFGAGPAYAMVAGDEERDGTRAFFHTEDRTLVEHLALQARRDLGLAVAE